MTPQIREIVETFTDALAQVFEAMAEQRPSIAFEEPVDAPEGGEMLCWEQPLQFAPNMKIWVAAPRETWEYSGALTLKAAGLETVEEGEARNTWLEILGQALSPLARYIGGILGHEVTCDGGSENTPSKIDEWVPLRMAFKEGNLAPLYVAFSPQLAELIAAPPAPPPPQPAFHDVDESEAEDIALPQRSRTMNLLLDVDLPVSISFGKTHLPMKDVIKLTTGSIVELNRGVSEPVEIFVNQCLVARGEVVVVEGNYGVRILEIASRQDRMRTLR
jgi:flagellar motor switch protein FliN/FliY